MAERRVRFEGVRSARDLALIPRASNGRTDDFVCLRYAVPYPSLDCAVRTKFDTSPGCRNCDQGRFNLKRHAATLRDVKFPLDLDP